MSVIQSRSRLGNAVKKAKADGSPPEAIQAVVDARRELTADKLADYIERTVAAAPPLTGEQRARLAQLFQAPPT